MFMISLAILFLSGMSHNSTGDASKLLPNTDDWNRNNMSLSPAQKIKLIDYWQKSSANDLKTVSDIISKTSRYSGGLFFLYLSLEKKLKALYVHKFGLQAPFSHNLLSLAEKCELVTSSSREVVLTEINEYNLESRYPDDKFSLDKLATKKFSELQLKNAKEILKWISLNFKN